MVKSNMMAVKQAIEIVNTYIWKFDFLFNWQNDNMLKRYIVWYHIWVWLEWRHLGPSTPLKHLKIPSVDIVLRAYFQLKIISIIITVI